MASGKSLEEKAKRTCTLYYNEDGSPIRRATPKIRCSKKERRRQRALLATINAGKEKAKVAIIDEALRGKPKA